MNRFDALMIAIAGLCGALGVAAAAGAAHAAEPRLGTISAMLLAHAPILFALGVASAGRSATGLRTGFRIAAAALTIGLALFAGDLAVRVHGGARLAPMAAPAGGLLLIAGWAVLALTGGFRALVPASAPREGES